MNAPPLGVEAVVRVVDQVVGRPGQGVQVLDEIGAARVHHFAAPAVAESPGGQRPFAREMAQQLAQQVFPLADDHEIDVFVADGEVRVHGRIDAAHEDLGPRVERLGQPGREVTRGRALVHQHGDADHVGGKGPELLGEGLLAGIVTICVEDPHLALLADHGRQDAEVVRNIVP